MMQETMKTLIQERLKELEEKENIEILFACEAGSRAKGMNTPDSDYDIRFVYKRKAEDYLDLNRGADMLTYPADAVWDMVGWDLDKILKLLYKSNPSVYEWFNSSIIYRDKGFKEKMTALLELYFSEEKMLYHYMNIARKNIANIARRDDIAVKDLLFALSAVLNCSWIKRYHKTPPVIEIGLRDTVLPEDLRHLMEQLISMKLRGIKNVKKNDIMPLIEYVKQVNDNTEKYLYAHKPEENAGFEKLNAFFLEEIGFNRKRAQ